MPESQLVSALFGSESFASPNILFVFGSFLVLGVVGAIIAHTLKWIPTITAFMLIGMAIGPSGANLIDATLLQKSSVVIDVALGLILYKLGSEVQLRHLLRSTSLWRVSLIEALFTYAAVFLTMLLMGSTALVASLIGAISISSSPAVLVHMAEETKARGPVIYRAKALLTLNNALSFLFFSLTLPFALGETTVSWVDMLVIPLYRATGAIAVGFVIAYLMAYVDYLLDNDKEDEHFRFALIIGGITIALGLASMLQVSTLFTALTLGIVTRWKEKQRQGLSTIEFGSSSDLFFIVLFVMAGANFHIGDIKQIGGIAVLLAFVRTIAKPLSFWLNKEEPDQTTKSIFALGLKLMPMGALAIGLAQTVQNFSPALGTKVVPIIFAMVALLETVGPFAVSAAIRMTGESALFRKEAAAAALATEQKEEDPTLSEEPKKTVP